MPRHHLPCRGQLLRAAAGVNGLDDEQARAHVRQQVPDADEQDLLLLMTCWAS